VSRRVDLPPFEWPHSEPPITAKTSPLGPLPRVKEFSPLAGLAAWLAAGGEPNPTDFQDTVRL
jgi:hypothetical protein